MKSDFTVFKEQGYEAVRKNFISEQKELERRRYILSVVYLGCELQKIFHLYPENLEVRIVKLSSRIQAVSQREISDTDMQRGKYLDDLLKEVKIDSELEKLKDGQQKILYFNNTIKEQIIDLLLTKEMKSIYLQASLEAELPESREIKKKKI